MISTEIRKRYQPSIGIETHVQLKTKTKLFCGCLNDPTVEEPNINICPICMGFPGSLPVLNEAAIALALRIGLALNGQIANETKFDRKNYFYPDLPKGYQISQYDQPIIGKGEVEVPLGDDSFKVGITRAHLEEDAGKLLHPAGADYSLLDLNRAGTPLVEIVSEPDIESAAQAKAYAREIYLTMLYSGVSDVDLYRGNMRFDVNVSVRENGAKELGTRSETKNLNSFRSVERAVEYEIDRQIELLEKGDNVVQETRGWDEAKGKTTSQRSKEEAHDYRYFPEPDLPPIVVAEKMVDEANRALADQSLPLPAQTRRVLKKSGLGPKQIEVLLSSRYVWWLMPAVDKLSKHVQRIANWLTTDIPRLHEESQLKVNPGEEELIDLAEMVDQGQLSNTAAKQVLAAITEGATAKDETGDVKSLAEHLNLIQVSDTKEVEKLVERVTKDNAKAVADYRKGNQNSLQFLVGQVMKDSKGQANPQVARDLLLKKIDQFK